MTSPASRGGGENLAEGEDEARRENASGSVENRQDHACIVFSSMLDSSSRHKRKSKKATVPFVLELQGRL